MGCCSAFGEHVDGCNDDVVDQLDSLPLISVNEGCVTQNRCQILSHKSEKVLSISDAESSETPLFSVTFGFFSNFGLISGKKDVRVSWNIRDANGNCVCKLTKTEQIVDAVSFKSDNGKTLAAIRQDEIKFVIQIGENEEIKANISPKQSHNKYGGITLDIKSVKDDEDVILYTAIGSAHGIYFVLRNARNEIVCQIKRDMEDHNVCVLQCAKGLDLVLLSCLMHVICEEIDAIDEKIRMYWYAHKEFYETENSE